MTDTLRLEIVSPERLLKDAEVASIVVPGTDGDFAVLPAHAPMMSTIRPDLILLFYPYAIYSHRKFLHL